MSEEKQGKCGDCRESVGTTAKAYVYCQLIRKQMLRDKVMQCVMREPGKRGAESCR